MKRKSKKEYLKLAQIIYGGEFYLELENYRLKEIDCINSKFDKITDFVLSKKGINDFFSYKNEDSGFVANIFETVPFCTE